MRELKQMTKNIKESNMPDMDSLMILPRGAVLRMLEDFVMVCKTCKATEQIFLKRRKEAPG